MVGILQVETKQDIFQDIVFKQRAIRLNKDTGIHRIVRSAGMANMQASYYDVV